MDLKRWLWNPHQLSDRIEQDLLGHEDRSTPHEPTSPHTHLENILTLPMEGFRLTSDTTTADEVVYGLRSFCLGAVALVRGDTSWSISSLSYHGQFDAYAATERPSFNLPVKTLSQGEVGVSSAEHFIRGARLTSFFNAPQGKALLFRPFDNEAIVALSDVAPLWEEDYVQSLRRLIKDRYSK